MKRRNSYRDANFAAYVEQIEVALDGQLWTISPVVEAVQRLRARLHPKAPSATPPPSQRAA